MNLVRYFDDGWRVGLLVKEDDRFAHVVIITPSRVDCVRLPSDDDSLIEYLDHSAAARTDIIRIAYTRGVTVRAAELLGDPELIEHARAASQESVSLAPSV